MNKLKILLLAIVVLPLFSADLVRGPKLIKQLDNYSEEVVQEFGLIPEERKQVLMDIGRYIYEERTAGESVQLTVICTHNSRRSHMGQLWMEVAAVWFGIDQVSAFSGGTETTAFNSRAVDALQRAGFRIKKVNNAQNPTYEGHYLRGFGKKEPLLMYSKTYDDRQNLASDFAAIMVCSEADESCPVVPGAEFRAAVPFEDPRYYDDTASEELKYDETVRGIAREMFYVMHYAKELLIRDQEKMK